MTVLTQPIPSTHLCVHHYRRRRQEGAGQSASRYDEREGRIRGVVMAGRVPHADAICAAMMSYGVCALLAVDGPPEKP